MTNEDIQKLERVAPVLRQHFSKIGVFSPWREAEGRVFPRHTAIPRRRWDLNRPGKRRFDLLVACNVFQYSPDPEKWFRHVLACCKYFLLVDLVRRRRSEASEFGTDGDVVRYAAGTETPRVDSFFDLNGLGERLLACQTYFGGANAHDESPTHVIALLKGDLAEPVVRIDDYPTGIRPILKDLSPIHAVLRSFETGGVPYTLGIVPALLTGEMGDFLRSLDYMRPAVHGFDHSYPKYAPLLERKDPYNERTVRTFNEFASQSEDTIRTKLLRGKAIIEEHVERAADVYIPPCNRADRKTGRALVDVGFKYYMSDKRIPKCRLPRFDSDFCGRSNQYNFGENPDVITLHTTWEWDVQRRGDSTSLQKLIEHLKDRIDASRRRDDDLRQLLQ